MVTQHKTGSFLVGMIMLLAFSGCGVQDDPSVEKKNPSVEQTLEKNTENSAENTKTVEDLKKLEELVFAEGFETEEYYREMRENAQRTQSDIVNREVYKSNNPESCNKLSTDSLVGSCKDDFYMGKASKEKKSALCEKIVNNDLQNYCKSYVIAQLARATNDITVCDSIDKEELKENCKADVYMKLAQKALDDSLCDKIKDVSTKRMCREEVMFTKEEKTRMNEMKKEMEKEEADELEEMNNQVDETIEMEMIPEEM